MAIVYQESSQVFTLQTKDSTYQMQVNHGFLLHLYYGKRVEHTEMTYLLEFMDRGFSGNPYDLGTDRSYSLDTLPQEYSAFGNGDFRGSCLSVIHPDGSNFAELRYDSHKIYEGKPALQGLPAVYCSQEEGQTLEIILRDAVSGLKATLLYTVLEDLDVITRSVVLENTGNNTLFLGSALSCCVDFNSRDFDLISFYGRHAMERCVERTPLRHGKLVVDSVRGASSHQQNPFVILADTGAGEEHGNCYGFSLVYSGNFLAQAEVNQTDNTRLVMGIHPEGFYWQLAAGESFTAPEVVLCYSSQGLGALSRKYHKLYRNHLCRGQYQHQRRPILINNWEGTYFDFDEKKLVQIAKEAGELGVEMLVMDDGWFGKRDDDSSGLGDWVVNTHKLKGGLEPLCREIQALGMKLGIWFEPEMVSEDSDLYRAHPDWCLQIPGRKNNRSRYQLVLDMSREDVRQYLFQAISAVLKSADIAYVKWDMNRHLTHVWSAKLPAQRQGEVYHRYVLGVYDLLERLTSAFPQVLFEGCSGGGGRFDAGMLYYSPQIWCSDDSDAIERIKIQYGTSFGYPISAVGSHVSAVPNHQTGRVTPLKTRGIVAYAGTFGYELDMSKVSPEEKEIIKEQILFYKEHYDLINNGEYYRLTDPFQEEHYAAWQFVSPDQKCSLVSYVQIRARANSPFVKIRLKGLNPEAIYTVNGEGSYSGSALLYAGFKMPVLWGDGMSEILKIEEK